MALGTKISSATAISMVEVVRTKLDAGAGAATVQIRKDAKPATVDTAHSNQAGDILVTLTLNKPSFDNATDAGTYSEMSCDVTPAISANAGNTGTAVWFRAYDSSGTAVIDGTAGEAADTTDMTLDSKNIVSGQPVSIVSWKIRHNE